MKIKLSVVIPVYKKTEMFIDNLRHNLKFLPKQTQIIIVDDASKEYLDEKLADLLRKNNVQLITNERNLGFSGAINRGIYEAQGEYIFLLNSDVRLEESLPENIYELFSNDASIIALAFAEKTEDGELLGKSTIAFKRGLVVHDRAHNNEQGITAWANGGSSLFRADYLKEIGAFNSLYSPFYWEDIDIAFRAYSRGYKIIFYPKYTVEHSRESTIKTYFSPSNVEHIAFRNQFLFTWINITDFTLIAIHAMWLPINLLLMSIKGQTQFVSGFFAAVRFLPDVYKQRSYNMQRQKKTNIEIFSLFA